MDWFHIEFSRSVNLHFWYIPSTYCVTNSASLWFSIPIWHSRALPSSLKNELKQVDGKATTVILNHDGNATFLVLSTCRSNLESGSCVLNRRKFAHHTLHGITSFLPLGSVSPIWPTESCRLATCQVAKCAPALTDCWLRQYTSRRYWAAHSGGGKRTRSVFFDPNSSLPCHCKGIINLTHPRGYRKEETEKGCRAKGLGKVDRARENCLE